jgi:hypothetical protein
LLTGLWACSGGNRERYTLRTPPTAETEPGTGGTSRTPASAASITLPAGSRYFEHDGQVAPLLMRNISASTPDAFTPLFAAARAAGTSLVRLQLTQGFGYDTLGIDSSGNVLEGWASAWDSVFDEAERQGLAVIPVFAIWGDWNDGVPARGWSHFAANPLGSARGGPAAQPAELFADTDTQRLWLGWLSALVRRWSAWPNVSAWELFSELDLASGASEADCRAFVERASAALRGLDPLGRPVFASTSDLPLLGGEPWTTLWASAGNDIVSVHPYDATLDRIALERVNAVLSLTDKPVLIGESGLDAAAPDGTTWSSAPGAERALSSAIWAELVSGAANARALYWEDGYSLYYPATGSALVTARAGLEQLAAQWLAGKDFSGLSAAEVSGSPGVFGAALASSQRAFGWVRDSAFGPPDWISSGWEQLLLQVRLPAGSADGAWRVELTDTASGERREVAGMARAGALSFDAGGAPGALAFAAQPLSAARR